VSRREHTLEWWGGQRGARRRLRPEPPPSPQRDGPARERGGEGRGMELDAVEREDVDRPALAPDAACGLGHDPPAMTAEQRAHPLDDLGVVGIEQPINASPWASSCTR